MLVELAFIHLILWNGCSQSNWVLKPILTVTKVYNAGETGDINDKINLNVANFKTSYEKSIFRQFDNLDVFFWSG